MSLDTVEGVEYDLIVQNGPKKVSEKSLCNDNDIFHIMPIFGEIT